jgi:hypothetical protein
MRGHFIVFVMLLTLKFCTSYKLNVPKVLLPFYSSQLMSFQLELRSEPGDPEHLCFTWSSSMTDYVTIEPILNPKNCSTRPSSRPFPSIMSKPIDDMHIKTYHFTMAMFKKQDHQKPFEQTHCYKTESEIKCTFF